MKVRRKIFRGKAVGFAPPSVCAKRALGRKVSDEFTVPLCRGHHREVHRRGDEAAWWQAAGLDPTIAARVLWLETHPLATAADGGSEATHTATAGFDKKSPKRDR